MIHINLNMIFYTHVKHSPMSCLPSVTGLNFGLSDDDVEDDDDVDRQIWHLLKRV